VDEVVLWDATRMGRAGAWYWAVAAGLVLGRSSREIVNTTPGGIARVSRVEFRETPIKSSILVGTSDLCVR
jgi:hypothetical protein